MGVMLHNLD